MHIEEFKGGDEVRIGEEEEKVYAAAIEVVGGGNIDAKRVLIGAGARALFYPTLLYNVVRNKIQAEFRWWDWIDKFVLLGAVPFLADVKRLKELGVCGVITLNEPYETLVPTSLYLAHGINHLVLPTRDYLFAPSFNDICHAVEFIHENTLHGRATYVHCKAGRGRSTTIVICYLVQHKHMTPDAAYDFVKSIRPRVLLASSQWQAVLEYYHLKVKNTCRLSHKMVSSSSHMSSLMLKSPRFFVSTDLFAFDDGSVVVVTEADLDGYDPNHSGALGSRTWSDLSLVYKVQIGGQAALARLSCLWFRCQKISVKVDGESSCSIRSDQLGGLSTDKYFSM